MVVNVSKGNGSRGSRALCMTCQLWRPSPHYPYAGYCTLWGRVTFEDDSCPSYSPLRLAPRRFYWCSSCKTRVAFEEAGSHALLGHRLHPGAYIERDVREEIYDAF